MSAYERAILLSSLVFIGRGDLLNSGLLPINIEQGEPGLFALAAACLIQAGSPDAAINVLSSLARTQPLSEYPLRYLMLASRALEDRGGNGHFSRALQYAGGVMPKPWVSYEGLRYDVSNVDPKKLGIAGNAAIRRNKHVARYYPFTVDSAVLEKEPGGPEFVEPSRGMPLNLKDSIGKMIAAARICAEDSEIAEELAFLSAVRKRFAPDADDPIQIISTGRAGTTAVYEWLDGGDYVPFHSFSWQLPPIHRWGLGARVAAGNVTSADLMPFVKAYIFLRLPELVSAYRAGAVPVIVSHWDSIFAPISAVLFGTRLTYHRRNPNNVIRSMVVKRQYACAQIACLPYRDNGEGYEFRSQDFSDHWGEHIAWYLVFTERYWEALKSVVPDHAYTGIEADGLFRGDSQTIRTLHENFPLRGRSEEETREKFSVPINVKSDKNVSVTQATEAVLAASHAPLIVFQANRELGVAYPARQR